MTTRRPLIMLKVDKKLECPDCSAEMVLRDSKYGKFYGCSRYPTCKGTHGAHQNSGEPLGTPANKETKLWRIKAHDCFDKLWRGSTRQMNRRDAYSKMQELMGLDSKKGHIGRFTKDQCMRLILLLAAEYPEMYREEAKDAELVREYSDDKRERGATKQVPAEG